MLDNSTNDVGGLKLLDPVLAIDANHRLLELLLGLSERFEIICVDVHYLRGLRHQCRVFSTFQFLTCAEICSFDTGRKGLFHNEVGL